MKIQIVSYDEIIPFKTYHMNVLFNEIKMGATVSNCFNYKLFSDCKATLRNTSDVFKMLARFNENIVFNIEKSIAMQAEQFILQSYKHQLEDKFPDVEFEICKKMIVYKFIYKTVQVNGKIKFNWGKAHIETESNGYYKSGKASRFKTTITIIKRHFNEVKQRIDEFGKALKMIEAAKLQGFKKTIDLYAGYIVLFNDIMSIEFFKDGSANITLKNVSIDSADTLINSVNIFKKIKSGYK